MAGLAALAACSDQDYAIKDREARMVASPLLSDAGDVAVGTRVELPITLTATDGDVTVLAATLLNIAGDAFVLDGGPGTVVPDGESATLTVRYQPTSAGWHRAQLTLQTDETQDEVHTLEMRGHAGNPGASLYPQAWDFGPVASGDEATVTLTLANPGDVPATVDGVSVGGPFTADLEPLTLDAGSTTAFTVTFRPTTDGAANQILTVTLGVTSVSAGLRGNDCANSAADRYDLDGDGVASCGGAADDGTSCFDDDADGVTEDDGDCNDDDGATSPDATEDYANGRDDDGDGVVDHGGGDGDGDGVAGRAGDCDGVTDEGTVARDDDGDGQAEAAGDCDDTDPTVWAGAIEAEDWTDNDCDGTVDEGTRRFDDDGDGATEDGGDCDDADPSTGPAAWDPPGDGADWDCDGDD